VDAVAVYVGQQVGLLAVEGIVAVFALISPWLVIILQNRFGEGQADFAIRNVEPDV
jgi:hypothetical protein